MDLRRVRSLKTKEHITEVALSLFQKKGFDHVTVDEIVKKSNTSKGAFYGHFSSKYEVFFEKFKEVDNFYSEFQLQLPQNILAKEKILKLAIAQMEFLKNELGRDLMRTIYMNALSSPNAGKLLSNTDRKVYLILEDFIQEGLDSGEIDKKHSKKELSIIITRTMRGTLYDWFIFEKEMDPVAEIRKILSLLLRGL
jgi:AcrR family transcriptional regulator